MGWPFWAPTQLAQAEQALDLAGLQPGERLVDLGCGDGRVLVVAARRGAIATGVELDPDLAALARRTCEEAGVTATIVEADFSTFPIEADVVFAFLSPAALQRLAPRLAALPAGTRIVTRGFGVPGWVPDEAADRSFLHRVPVRTFRHEVEEPGWENAGVLVGLRSGVLALIGVKLHHPGGAVDVGPANGLERTVSTFAGAEQLDRATAVVVDLEWPPQPAGTVVSGTLEAGGFPPLAVFGVYTDGDTGVWGLRKSGVERVGRALAGTASPARAEAVLDAARRVA